MDRPQYLYHYTTIDTLALILKYKTIRFNSLANVDDLEEQESADLSNFGKFCYASCWTADKKENIALWNMYSKNGTGVRIKLASNPFKKNKIELPQNDGKISIVESHYESLTINNSKGYIDFNFWPAQEVCLIPIVYTDDEYLRKPDIYEHENNSTTIKWGLLGNIKSTLWTFQNEWRFCFSTIPAQIGIYEQYGYDSEKIKLFCESLNPPFEYYDISIDDDAFSEMGILMGPSITESDSIIINSLIKTFNPTAQLAFSSLKNTVKFKK